MPTNRKRRRQVRRVDVAELDWNTEYELLHGAPMLPGGFDGDLDAFTAAWDYHGERLLAEFIEANPGRRPFAWWMLDHGNERPIAEWATPEQVRVARQSRDSCNYGYLHGKTWHGAQGWLQEPESIYLHRLGLLTDAEVLAIGLPSEPAVSKGRTKKGTKAVPSGETAKGSWTVFNVY